MGDMYDDKILEGLRLVVCAIPSLVSIVPGKREERSGTYSLFSRTYSITRYPRSDHQLRSPSFYCLELQVEYS
jgi:hypothetical protein